MFSKSIPRPCRLRPVKSKRDFIWIESGKPIVKSRARFFRQKTGVEIQFFFKPLVASLENTLSVLLVVVVVVGAVIETRKRKIHLRFRVGFSIGREKEGVGVHKALEGRHKKPWFIVEQVLPLTTLPQTLFMRFADKLSQVGGVHGPGCRWKKKIKTKKRQYSKSLMPFCNAIEARRQTPARRWQPRTSGRLLHA